MQHLLQKKYFWGLIAILLVAFCLRSYELGSWLHFELDQSRDAKVVDLALDGNVLDLPLLGPKAGGTFLRLAPAFYYFSYVSAKLFGGMPVGGVWFVVVLSTLFVGGLFFFLRRGFSQEVSFGLTALAAVSVYLVLYGRFAWNPNLIPFFVVFGFYALLRSVDHEEVHKERWFLGAALLLTLATHFHFLAFLALPTVTGLFLLLKRPRFRWSTWLAAFGIIAFLYVPMILNEVATKGSNTKEFFGAITEKSTKEDHTLIEKGVRDIAEFSMANTVILTGYEGSTFPNVLFNSHDKKVICDKRCDEGKWQGIAGLLFVLVGLWTTLLGWWRARTRASSDFYLLSLLWLGVALLLFLPLSYGVAPRFYLLTAPLSFVLLGSIFENIHCLHRTKKKYIFFLVVGLLVATNIFFLRERFGELKDAGTHLVVSQPDRILKERIRVTLEQQETIVNFVEQASVKTGYPVYFTSGPQYKRSFKYLLEKRGVTLGSFSLENRYQEGLYYMVLRSGSGLENKYAPYLGMYELVDIKSFGTLSLVELRPRPGMLIGAREDFSLPVKKAESQAPPRYTWREFFSGGVGQVDDTAEEDEVTDDN